VNISCQQIFSIVGGLVTYAGLTVGAHKTRFSNLPKDKTKQKNWHVRTVRCMLGWSGGGRGGERKRKLYPYSNTRFPTCSLLIVSPITIEIAQKLLIWPPCCTVLTGEIRNDLSRVRHSDDWNMFDLIAADISHYRWTCAIVSAAQVYLHGWRVCSTLVPILCSLLLVCQSQGQSGLLEQPGHHLLLLSGL